MGTMINRRRVMGGKADIGYITDGLVFHLDGIIKGSDVNAWTDLVGNVKFPYIDGITPRYNYVSFDGTKNLVADRQMTIPYDTYTIEAVFELYNGFYVVFIPTTANELAIGVYNNYQIYRTRQSSVRYSTSLSGIRTVSVSSDGVYVDNVAATAGNSGSLSYTGQYPAVGGRGSNYYNGNLYSLRIYNRHLSAAEREHNVSIDKQRFNL